MVACDAVLLVSFGGPEGPDDVAPFLANVTRGRGIPAARLADVAEVYLRRGGISPINERCRELRDALRGRLGEVGIDLPVYWGNRNWHPFLVDAVRELRDDGVGRALAVLTSAYSSPSSCRQYLDNIAAARLEVPGAPLIDVLPPYWDQPGFVAPMAESVAAQWAALGPGCHRLVCTAHSLPEAMAVGCDYVAQLRATAARVAALAGVADDGWDLVFQSRSGPPQVPWLGPDVGDHLEALAADGVAGVVVAPIGFVADHMEVIHDLDTVAASRAAEAGLEMRRAATVGTHPEFVEMLVGLVQDHLAREVAQACAPGCCPS